jgi:hypothetical protein
MVSAVATGLIPTIFYESASIHQPTLQTALCAGSLLKLCAQRAAHRLNLRVKLTRLNGAL